MCWCCAGGCRSNWEVAQKTCLFKGCPVSFTTKSNYWSLIAQRNRQKKKPVNWLMERSLTYMEIVIKLILHSILIFHLLLKWTNIIYSEKPLSDILRIPFIDITRTHYGFLKHSLLLNECVILVSCVLTCLCVWHCVHLPYIWIYCFNLQKKLHFTVLFCKKEVVLLMFIFLYFAQLFYCSLLFAILFILTYLIIILFLFSYRQQYFL